MPGIKAIRFTNPTDSGRVIHGAIVRGDSGRTVWSSGHDIDSGDRPWTLQLGDGNNGPGLTAGFQFFAAVKIIGDSGTCWDSRTEWTYDPNGVGLDYAFENPAGGSAYIAATGEFAD